MVKYYHRTLRAARVSRPKKFKSGSWVMVEHPTKKELDKISKDFDLDRGHLDDAIDEDEMPRLERRDDVIYFYTRTPQVTPAGETSTSTLLLIIGSSFFMTISSSPLPGLDQIISRPQFSTTQRTKLFIETLHEVFYEYDRILTLIGKQVKSVRARLRSQAVRNADFIKFVEIEDDINEFLSALQPTNVILRRVLLGKHIRLYEEDRDLVEDLLLNNEQSVEECRSTLKTVVNIREAHSTIMTNNLNRIMKILTVATLVLSVPTLIASLYGMNVDLPYSQSSNAFLIITLVSLMISGGMMLYFVARRWI